jgi:hypothetical protein
MDARARSTNQGCRGVVSGTGKGISISMLMTERSVWVAEDEGK